MRSGESMTTVSTGTRRPSWRRRSPCGAVAAREAPDASQRGGSAGAGAAQPLHDRAVHGLPVVQRPFRGEDHELLPHRHAVAVGAGQCVRSFDEFAVALAHAHPLQGDQRAAEQGAELGQHPTDPFPRAHRDDHHGDVGVRGEEPGPPALAVRGPVHAQQHGGPGHAAAVQQVTHRDERRHPIHPFLPAHVDRQLGRLVQLLGQHDRTDLVAQHPGPLQGHQAGVLHRPQLVEHRLDPRAGVHRNRHQRQVLGQAEQPVRPQVVFQPEALGAAQQDAGGELPLLEQVQLRVGEEPPVHALPLTEVGGELETVLVHSCIPIHRPTAAAATPATRLTARFATRCRTWRSSPSRWVSNIQVENVV